MILKHNFQQRGISAAEAQQQAEIAIRADISNGLQQLAEFQSETFTQTGQPEGTIVGIARFVCEFYTRHDFHTFAAVQESAPFDES